MNFFSVCQFVLFAVGAVNGAKFVFFGAGKASAWIAEIHEDQPAMVGLLSAALLAMQVGAGVAAMYCGYWAVQAFREIFTQ